MPKSDVTFEKALKNLEGIIEKLESDDLTLDKALEYFEKGISLMRTCESHLKSAEGKLKELLKGEDGEFVEKTLGITADSLISGDYDNE
ncbi:MAG: exodeoxyribonuclease VII small subunit [Chitinivibrionales bacterium]|nr:exodeoxyribonuclease VII small subunit [Chitinivibrionales bacterium]